MLEPGTPVRDSVQELLELGLRGTLFRIGWELKMRSGLPAIADRLTAFGARRGPAAFDLDLDRARRLFGEPDEVGGLARDRCTGAQLASLRSVATDAARGKILCFSRWTGDFGEPIDWQRNPTSGERWDRRKHWTRALADAGRVGDVKLTWEVGRFPQAYHMARAARIFPELSEALDESLAEQIASFSEQNPRGRGVHWHSSQEIAFRLMAWCFAIASSPGLAERDGLRTLVAGGMAEGAVHIGRHIGYARNAVFNNHLLSEALGLLLVATLLPGHPQADRWGELGLDILVSQADRQFYEDGGYIQHSHNYHRLALQDLLWVAALRRAAGEPLPEPIRAALARSVDFLYAQQNPTDGRLPNFGANDGALPSILSMCDYTDFRPTLQAASLVARGERLYEPGAWDEEAAWWLGAAALDAPLRRAGHRSRSFPASGYHVLRGNEPSSFGLLRCGALRDRFGQIDMLHLDVWWRGHNVLADGGSYLYNGPAPWHDHFMRTASHNTVVVDGQDQMVHFRKFKTLYRTQARTLRFTTREGSPGIAGEHHGYRRLPGRPTHARAVLLDSGELWAVVDRITGTGTHRVRLHWQAGAFSFRYTAQGGLELTTPDGPFRLHVHDHTGATIPAEVVAGQEAPPRGWLSRYYGEKTAAPSLTVELDAVLPVTLVSLCAAGRPQVAVEGQRWTVTLASSTLTLDLAGDLSELAA